jgi:ubiquitin-protein ligase
MTNNLEKNVQDFDNHCIVLYNNVSSKIIFPTNDYNFYLVSPHNDTDYDWYDSLNGYCIEKRPSKEKLFARLFKCIDKQNILGIKKFTPVTIMAPIISTKLTSIDDYDVSYYRMKEKLVKIGESSHFLVNEFSNNTRIKSIYNEKILANILVEEYLKCWESTKALGISLELINENIFSWKIKFNSFQNKNIVEDLERLQSECGLKHVEVEIFFHGKLYPNYPPVVRITKPTFLNSLSHRISNSKMVQLSYWTPSRSVMYIIGRLTNLLNKWGRIDFGEAVVQVAYSPAIIELNSNLQKLSSFIDSVKQNDEIDLDEEFISFNFIGTQTTSSGSANSSSKSKGAGWKSGTGYGTSGSVNWDPTEFIKLQQEKDSNVINVLSKVIDNLYNVQSSEYNQMCEVIQRSLLISYLKQQFTSVSLLDIKSRLAIYKLCFSIITELAHEETIKLFDIKYEGCSDSLYDVLTKLQDLLKMTQSITYQIDETDKIDKADEDYNEFEITMSTSLEVMIIPLYEEYKQHEVIINRIPHIVNNIGDTRDLYVQTMSKLKFKSTDILSTNYKDLYKKTFETALASGANFNQCKKRLRVEIPTFKQDGSLPIDYDSSIFVRVDQSNPMIMRMLVTGPKDTPYDSGCLIFDIYTPENYPSHCPDFKFMNHGGKRFNPNLYGCGKVCLSILGQSYIGPSASKSEKWNDTSSLLQVMVSIQSQILIENPYFNEPGYESSMGTSSGDTTSKTYNENIRLYTMSSTIHALLENPDSYPQFKDVILNHFRLKKDYVSQLCDKWTAEVTSGPKKTEYTNLSNKIKELLEKL